MRYLTLTEWPIVKPGARLKTASPRKACFSSETSKRSGKTSECRTQKAIRDQRGVGVGDRHETKRQLQQIIRRIIRRLNVHFRRKLKRGVRIKEAL